MRTARHELAVVEAESPVAATELAIAETESRSACDGDVLTHRACRRTVRSLLASLLRWPSAAAAYDTGSDAN